MRVVILGHRGFVGSAISEHMRSRGADVVGVDRGNHVSLRGTRGDLLINANGSSDKRLADIDPVASFRANVVSTIASIVDFPCSRYVHISTVNVYADLRDPAKNHEEVDPDPARLPRYGYFKYLAEQLVRREATRWVILRLGPLVGPGLRKNAIYDLLGRGTLFVHPDSYLCYIDTRTVAEAVWQLRDSDGQIFNVCGKGAVKLSEVAHMLGVPLPDRLYALPRDRYLVSVEKLSRRMDVPESAATVAAFVDEWRSVRAGPGVTP